MHLEPQPIRGAGERRIVVLRLQAEPGGEDCGHGVEVRTWCGLSSYIALSEPMPFGVFIVVQVPLATYFQALPW